MIHIDHIGVAAHDPLASARTLADILGAPPPTADGADGDMFRVDLDDGAFLLFSLSPAAAVPFMHVAFRVHADRFGAIVERLRRRGTPFGNDPEDPRNGRTDDPLGGAGRVYFADDNAHLFEVTC
jgi:catechol 2,3-dioxygenase-like lactoylglutathione lyase family enzyme